MIFDAARKIGKALQNWNCGRLRHSQKLGLALALACVGNLSQAEINPAETQNQIKAQFIYNFVNYVEWPADAFENATSSIRICIYGDVPFSSYLLSFAGSVIGERELTFIISTAINDIYSGCHILYVGNDRRLDLPKFWKQIKYTYVLSVGEQRGFSDQGGIINIVRTRDKLQFDVNISNALKNGLFLDSDLLSLARVIKRNTAPK